MSSEKRRSSTPVTDILYPRKRTPDSTPAPQRLEEHRTSKSTRGEARGLTVRVHVGGKVLGRLEREIGKLEPAGAPKRRRRGGRGRKQVAA